MRRNFIPGPNPFSIAAPPEWFLDELAAFDSELVLFWSQEQPCFQVARRLSTRRYARPSARHPDTMVFAVHNLHPVARLLPSPFTKWGPTILADLAARDVDRVGGGDKAADILDGFDREEEDRFRAQLDGKLDYVTREAWNYKTQTHFSGGRRGGKRASRSVPSIGRPNFRPGGSAVFVGERHVRPMPPKRVADVFLDNQSGARAKPLP